MRHCHFLGNAGRIWLERLVFVTTIAVLGIWFFFVKTSAAPHAISVNGKDVVVVESRDAVKAAFHALRSQSAPGINPESVQFLERVRFHPVRHGEIADIPEAVQILREKVTLQADLVCILADGKPIGGFPSQVEAEKALDLVKDYYKTKIGVTRADSTFKEIVQVKRALVSLDKFYPTAYDALESLITPAGETTYHTVKRGDVAVNIAARYHCSLSELAEMNPGVDLNRITEGDRLLVATPKPPITVITKVSVRKTVLVNPPPGAGSSTVGTREIRLLQTYENDTKVSEDVISQITTWSTR